MTEATCPYCGPLTDRGTYRDEGDPPDALYCKRCGKPVEQSEPGYVRQARYLGHDAALAAASWLEMSEGDARSIVDDVDPGVLDRYPEPNLSGEWADDPTPVSLAHEVGANDGDIAFWSGDLLDPICDAWEQAVDAAWDQALQAHALRVVGRITSALEVEAELEAEANRLREAARS